MNPGLSLKTPPPSPHSEGIVLVPAVLSKDPVLSIKTLPLRPQPASVLIVHAAQLYLVSPTTPTTQH